MNKFVTIIEDDSDLLLSLKALFEENGFQVQGFPTAKDFYEKHEKLNNCIYLVDWNLPGEPGTSIVKKIREEDKIAPIFMMSANNKDQQVIEALKTGADQYMRKPFDSDELLARLNNVYFKIEHLQQNLFNFGVKLLPEASTVIRDGIPVSLTEREFIIFQSLYERKDMITRDELMRRFDPELKMSSRNIDVHIFSLRRKMKKLEMCIETVWGSGYRLHLDEAKV